MNPLKDRTSLVFPAHSRTPYSRPNTQGFFKFPKAPSTSTGSTFVPKRPLIQRNPHMYFYEDVNDSAVENYGPSTSRNMESFKNRQGDFRPRKSHVPFQEMETMSIGNVSDVTDVSRRAKFTKTTEETSPDSFQIKVRENSLRILSGSVAKLSQWYKLKEKYCIVFEVRAVLESVSPGKWSTEKILHLADSKGGPRMQVLYYEIDRPLPSLPTHSVVRCIGRLLTRNRLHAFKVEEISEEDRNDGQRLSFICNRVAEELVALQQKK